MADIAVIFGGPSPEHDVSVLSGLQAARALSGRQPGTPRVRALYWDKVGEWFEVDPGLEGPDFADGPPRGATPLRLVAAPGAGFVPKGGRLSRDRPLEVDVAVNCCHGGPGEDGTLQAALDLAGVAYTGPTAAGAALGMDKLAFAGTVSCAGLPSLPRVLLDAADPGPGWPSFDGPYIVKPRFGGSSIGIEVVSDVETARARLSANPHLRQGAVLEPYRPDLYDVQIAIRTWPELQLSAIERPLRSTKMGEILSYADKYVGGEGMASAPRELPAALDPDVGRMVHDAARRVAALVCTRGVARLDFLSDGRVLYVNEINTIPGSLAKYLWVEPTLPFGQLLADLVAEAGQRPSTHWTSAGADGTALRSAGTIAAKLG